jgi:hypothetical protein
MAMQLAHTSLLRGWIPMALQIIAASVLVLAIGWRSRRWRMLWVPASVLLGVLAAGGTYWYFDWSGLVGHAAPPMLWIWTMLTGLAWGGIDLRLAQQPSVAARGVGAGGTVLPALRGADG